MSPDWTWVKREVVWESVRRNVAYQRDYREFRTRFDPWFTEKRIRKGIDPWTSTLEADYWRTLSGDDSKIFLQLVRWIGAFQIQWLLNVPLDPRMNLSIFGLEYPPLFLALINADPDLLIESQVIRDHAFKPVPIDRLVLRIKQLRIRIGEPVSRAALRKLGREIENYLESSEASFRFDMHLGKQEDLLRIERLRTKAIMSTIALSVFRGTISSFERRVLEEALTDADSLTALFNSNPPNHEQERRPGRPAGRSIEEYREDFRIWDKSQEASLREIALQIYPKLDFGLSLERRLRRHLKHAKELIEGGFRKLPR